MASQGPHNTSGYSSGQAQIRRNDLQNQDHETDFLQETGTQVTNMIQGAAEIGKGAALGAVSMAKGAAVGAANVAHGAADALKHTFGTDTNTTITAAAAAAADNTSDWPSNSNYHPGAGNTNWPSNTTNHPTRNPKNSPTNATNNLNADATKYPSNLLDDLMDDPAAQDAHWPSHLNNPNTGNI